MQQEEQVSLMWLSCMSLLLEKRVRMEEMEEEDAEVRRTSHEGQTRVVLWTWRVSLSSRKEG